MLRSLSLPSKITNNHSSISLNSYIHFIRDHLHCLFYTSVRRPRYPDLLQCTSIMSEILLNFVFHTFWLKCGLHDEDLRKMETFWKFISVFNQFDAQNLFYKKFISYLYKFRAHVLIIRRSKLHYTASGIITPIGLLIPEAVQCNFDLLMMSTCARNM